MKDYNTPEPTEQVPTESLLIYSTVLKDARNSLGISNNEYILCDTISHLAFNESNSTGWCWASKETLAQDVGVSKRSIQTLLNHLEKLELIERNKNSSNIRTTKKWLNTISKNREETSPSEKIGKKLHTDREETSPLNREETSHYINTNNNNNITTYTSGEFLEDFNRITGRGFKLVAGKTLRQFNSLIKVASRDEILKAISSANNDDRLTGKDTSGKNYLTPEYITRPDKFELYLNLTAKPINESKWKEFLDMIRDFTKLPVEATETAKFQFQKLWDAGYKDEDFERVYEDMWKDPFMKKNFTNLDYITRFNVFINFI